MKKLTKKFYTVTEAARKLRVTRTALHKAITDKRIHATWTTMKQVIEKPVLMISARSLKSFKVDKAQQGRGKKN